MTISGMIRFCSWAIACWAICWSLCRRWFGFGNPTRDGKRTTFWLTVSRGFALSIRSGSRLCAEIAQLTRSDGGRLRDGPAGLLQRWCAPNLLYYSRHFGDLPPWQQAAERFSWPECATDLTILKRLRRVAV